MIYLLGERCKKKTQRKKGYGSTMEQSNCIQVLDPHPSHPCHGKNLPVKTAALAGADETIIFLRSCCHLTHVLVRWTAGQVRSHSHVQYFFNNKHVIHLSSDIAQFRLNTVPVMAHDAPEHVTSEPLFIPLCTQRRPAGLTLGVCGAFRKRPLLGPLHLGQ